MDFGSKLVLTIFAMFPIVMYVVGICSNLQYWLKAKKRIVYYGLKPKWYHIFYHKELSDRSCSCVYFTFAIASVCAYLFIGLCFLIAKYIL